MLWNRSLVMIDSETKSLWSHLLGRAMRGPLKDAELQRLPSLMTDWQTWRKAYPDTTVLAMSRTSEEYRREFYDHPGQFVIGIAEGDEARAWSFKELTTCAVSNDRFAGSAVLVAFDVRNLTAYLYDRRVDDRDLEFELSDGVLLDRETRSSWNLTNGNCMRGELSGAQLKPMAGIVSYLDAWRGFHPNSTYWKAPP